MADDQICADTLIVSDIHAGWRFSRSVACVQLIRRFHGRRLVVLGDALHHPKRRHLDQKIQTLLGAISDAPRSGIETIFVCGNHDPSADHISSLLPGVNVCHEYSWQSGPTRCYARHGHQFNQHNRAWVIGDILQEIPDYAHHFIQRLEGRRHRLSRFIRRLVEKLLGLNDALIKGMASHLAKNRIKTDAAFFGHTHMAEARTVNGIKFCNPGCWVGYDDGMISYILIDGQGEIAIKKFFP